MALKNITDENIDLMWNGVVRRIIPNGEIDIRDFNVENKNVWNTETCIMDKHPGMFQRVASREQNIEAQNVELSSKTRFLEDNLAEAKEELKQCEAIAESLQNQVGDLTDKNNKLTQALEEANALLAENKIISKKKK